METEKNQRIADRDMRHEVVRNKLDKFFGPAGSFAGYFLIVAGIVASFFSLTGLILVLIGAFMGFTYSSTLVEPDKKRLRFTNNLFGFIPVGNRTYIEPDMKIGIRKTGRSWSAYSLSNRPLDIARNDFRIVLLDKNGQEIIPIKRETDLESAKANLDVLGRQLELRAE
ncbi:MAG: hypothetical protein JXR52_06280 [Bacteroidales bacterium]|nr:hypothetical protein [Bacteroidales bacterium]